MASALIFPTNATNRFDKLVHVLSVARQWVQNNRNGRNEMLYICSGGGLLGSFGDKIKPVAVAQQAARHVDDFLHVAVEVGNAFEDRGRDVGVVALDVARCG